LKNGSRIRIQSHPVISSATSPHLSASRNEVPRKEQESSNARPKQGVPNPSVPIGYRLQSTLRV